MGLSALKDQLDILCKANTLYSNMFNSSSCFLIIYVPNDDIIIRLPSLLAAQFLMNSFLWAILLLFRPVQNRSVDFSHKIKLSGFSITDNAEFAGHFHQ